MDQGVSMGTPGMVLSQPVGSQEDCTVPLQIIFIVRRTRQYHFLWKKAKLVCNLTKQYLVWALLEENNNKASHPPQCILH